ncbi:MULTISPECIES: glycosyltransferase family 2 protein [unclassified Blastococcus]
MPTPTISVVVISYNYAEYLPAAIDSALAQTYPVDVLVVDDGSTDGSREIIEGYGDRLRSIFKPNGGNSSVMNTAVPATSGEVVMFLDADDLLDPEAAAAVAEAWTDDCSKVQFRLSLIDGDGQRRGVDPPADVPMPTGDVVPELVATGHYVTPVTTGNAFRRVVLEKVLPIPEADFRNTNDGYLNLASVFEGPVVSVDRELGSYRLHGGNLWAYSGEVDLAGIRQRISYDLTRQRYLERIAAEHGRAAGVDLPLRNPEHVLQRLLSLRLDPAGHPGPAGECVGHLLRAGIGGVLRPGPDVDTVQRATLAVGLPLAAVLPARLLQRLAEALLASRPRGPLLRAAGRVVRQLSRALARLRSRPPEGRV